MWTFTNHTDWPDLTAGFPWLRDLEQVPQDPHFHAEGDVATHTRMVLDALRSLDEFGDLTLQDQQMLIAAALLHDLEKRSTTVIGPDGRISSNGHAKKGEYSARSLIYREHPAPFAVREQVAKLVRYHGLPLWLFEKPDPKKELLRVSQEVDTRLLWMVARADVLGRECPDKQDLLYRVDLFGEWCRELGCFGTPYAFGSTLARYHYFNQEGAHPGYLPYDDRHTEVILMSGLPGAGKDTYIRRFLKDWPVLSLDDLRRELGVHPTDTRGTGHAVQLAKERAREHLRRRRPFVWNATNLTRQRRQPLIDLFASYGARVKVVYVEVPYDRVVAQNAGRADVVPRVALERMIDKLEIPAVYEGHEIVFQVGG